MVTLSVLELSGIVPYVRVIPLESSDLFVPALEASVWFDIGCLELRVKLEPSGVKLVAISVRSSMLFVSSNEVVPLESSRLIGPIGEASVCDFSWLVLRVRLGPCDVDQAVASVFASMLTVSSVKMIP